MSLALLVFVRPFARAALRRRVSLEGRLGKRIHVRFGGRSSLTIETGAGPRAGEGAKRNWHRLSQFPTLFVASASLPRDNIARGERPSKRLPIDRPILCVLYRRRAS